MTQSTAIAAPSQLLPHNSRAARAGTPAMTMAEVRETFKRKAAEIAPVTPLSAVIEVFRRWLYMEDVGVVLTMLATIAANLMNGEPVWLMIVGASGGGKTEPLNAAGRLPFVHLVSTVTESSLLSGTPKKEKAAGARGGLLRTVGSFGFLFLKDFTSMLARRKDESTAVLAAFREIYDQSWTRHVGSDGGQTLHWDGKIGLIACCTDTIDTHHAVIGSMGERFAFFRLPTVDQRQLSRHALCISGRESQMRDELSQAVAGLFAGVTIPESPPDITEDDLEHLINLAHLTARCRSAIERDNYSRDITLVLTPEAPTRIAKLLRQMLHGYDSIGVPRADAWALLQKMAFDSMHKNRRAVVESLRAGETKSTAEIAAGIGYPTSTVRRSLEDLRAHDVLVAIKGGTGKCDSWRLSDWTIDILRRLDERNQTFPVFLTDDISLSLNTDFTASDRAANSQIPEKRERSPLEADDSIFDMEE